MLHKLEGEVKVKRQKTVKRWRIAQEAEREGWQKFRELLMLDSTRKRLAKYWGWYIDLIAKYISFKPEHRILDIGCGPVGIINYIPVGQRFGLDPLMNFYLLNFEMPDDIVWKQGIMEEIPFDSNYFDVIITMNTLDHSLNPEKGLREMYRILKKGGFLILSVNCYAPFRRLLRIVKEKSGMKDKAHPYSFSQRQIKAMIEKAAFRLLASHKGIGTMGMWFYEKCQQPDANIIFSVEKKIFGYSCIDFIFIAQKSI